MNKPARLLLAAVVALAILAALLFTLLFENESGFAVSGETGETILLAFAGDILVHQEQIDAALNPDSGEYEFDGCFTGIRPLIEPADLSFCNLEATLAGAEFSYTGYPCFNAPESLAGALKRAGFDVVSTANNHCLDRGETGVYRTLDRLEEAGIYTFGTYRTAKERDTPLVVTIKGVKLAFIGYTYGTNGIPLPQEYIVNLLDEELILRDLHKARRAADLVVLYLHWGHEYNRYPSIEQTEMAEKFLRAGADIIIGTHPHVIQPVEFIKTAAGRDLKEHPVAYSLGNFISDQRLAYTDTGIILFVKLSLHRKRKTAEPGPVSYIPVWVHKYHSRGRLQFRVLPVPQALEAYRRGEDAFLDQGAANHLEEILKETREHLQFLPLFHGSTQ